MRKRRKYQFGGIVDPSIEALAKIVTFKNRGLPWVDRAMNPNKYPVSNQDEFMENGKVMSHKMAWGSGENGEYQVFPTIGYKDGKLMRDDRQQPITVKDKKLAEFLAENGIIDHRKQMGGEMRKNKSMFQCMKCGGNKMKTGGLTIKEINRGLPMRQPGGAIGLPPSYDETEYNQAPMGPSSESPQTIKGFATAQDVNDRDPYGKVQAEYTQSAHNLLRKYPKGYFDNNAQFHKRPKSKFDWRGMSNLVTAGARGLANMFGPQQENYQSNPLVNIQQGQQSYGDTNVAQLGGLPFGPSMEDGGVSAWPTYQDMRKGGNWIQGAVNPAHKGYCTPMTKATCTPRRKAFAMTMKKHHGFHKEEGGYAIPFWKQYGGYNFLGQNRNV